MEYLVSIAIFIGIYAILAIGLNLIVGYTGMLSVAQAAFYGIGAYATAILTTSYHMNFFLSLVAGILVAGIVALAIGVVLSRFRDDYLALASFGFNVIIFSIFLNAGGLTRGPLGIPGIPRPEVFGFSFDNNLVFLLLLAAFALAIYAAVNFIVSSSFGRILKAIREDEVAISVFGYRPLYYKLTIFVIGSMMAAVAGSFFAGYISFVDPSSFSLNESIFILAIIILGGLASIRGSFVGALFLILLPEILRFVGFPTDVAAQMRQVTYGLILIILMLYRPQGLLGEYRL